MPRYLRSGLLLRRDLVLFSGFYWLFAVGPRLFPSHWTLGIRLLLRHTHLLSNLSALIRLLLVQLGRIEPLQGQGLWLQGGSFGLWCLIVRDWHGRVLLGHLLGWPVHGAPSLLKLIGVDKFFDGVDRVVIVLQSVSFGVLAPRSELHSQLLLQSLRLPEPLLEHELLLQALLGFGSLLDFNLLFNCLLFAYFSRVCESTTCFQHILLRQHQQGRRCQRLEWHLPEVVAWNAHRSAR